LEVGGGFANTVSTKKLLSSAKKALRRLRFWRQVSEYLEAKLQTQEAYGDLRVEVPAFGDFFNFLIKNNALLVMLGLRECFKARIKMLLLF